MNNQIIPANQDVVNLRNLLTVYHSYTCSLSGYGFLFAASELGISYGVLSKVLDKIHPLDKPQMFMSSGLPSCGLFDSQTELGRRQINAVLEVINELQPENLFDNSFGFD